ncbi:putative RNA-directed DNA polymerase from transposon BS [Trichonephila clavipes]|nr:putative RNA-directed DNA polymerase from transposon BS [Trichonephila clavipes]
MYVDDTAIFTQNIYNRNIIEQHYRLEIWLNDWKIKVNAPKSACLLFTRQWCIGNLPHVNIFNQPVPWVTEYKYLGLILDTKLNFSKHIRFGHQKAAGMRSTLNHLISPKSKLALRRKVLLYKAILRPIMLYASSISAAAADLTSGMFEALSYLGFGNFFNSLNASGTYRRPAELVSLVLRTCILVLPKEDFLYCAALYKTSPTALEYNKMTLTKEFTYFGEEVGKEFERVYSTGTLAMSDVLCKMRADLGESTVEIENTSNKEDTADSEDLMENLDKMLDCQGPKVAGVRGFEEEADMILKIAISILSKLNE